MRSRLTARKLKAIIEALLSRTAGEIDVGGDLDSPSIEDYEQALEWALEQVERRQPGGRVPHLPR